MEVSHSSLYLAATGRTMSTSAAVRVAPHARAVAPALLIQVEVHRLALLPLQDNTELRVALRTEARQDRVHVWGRLWRLCRPERVPSAERERSLMSPGRSSSL